jgi:arylsulfatase
MASKATNVIIFLADDLGYSDIAGYGGEIRTPNLDRLASRGVKLSNFHNTPRCSPSRRRLCRKPQ